MVAVAGPAVNVVIALLLLIGFKMFMDRSLLSALVTSASPGFSDVTMDEEMIQTVDALFSSPSLTGFAVLMFVVNVMLVLFNMIPAFPMDGGRVFRSLMAMLLDYRKATWIASRVGLVCAAADGASRTQLRSR